MQPYYAYVRIELKGDFSELQLSGGKPFGDDPALLKNIEQELFRNGFYKGFIPVQGLTLNGQALSVPPFSEDPSVQEITIRF
ncbi:hypothetical protein IPG41_03275 [Candidatus Peregrinibacteria bacterium]|nr:MAG: hypothetical protein IPG41_03275 [Candidatus Peregrinibacteria bacterium]